MMANLCCEGRIPFSISLVYVYLPNKFVKITRKSCNYSKIKTYSADIYTFYKINALRVSVFSKRNSFVSYRMVFAILFLSSKVDNLGRRKFFGIESERSIGYVLGLEIADVDSTPIFSLAHSNLGWHIGLLVDGDV